MRALLAALLLAAPAGAAEPKLITDLSQSRIDISYRFAGAELLVFGAVQYPGGQAPGDAPGIAVVLRGPAQPLVVRRKARVAGVWVNTASQRFESVPGYYGVALTGPVRELLDERNAAIHEIGLRHLQLSPAGYAPPEEARMFAEGLIAMREGRGLYVEQPGGVRLTANTLYSARLPVPSAVPVGSYEAQIFLIRKGRVLARSSVPIVIRKTGFERSVFEFSRQRPLLYGLSAVAAAAAFGWAAGLVTRRRRP
jgi:uncharacterized protein (TIGR02186 family)